MDACTTTNFITTDRNIKLYICCWFLHSQFGILTPCKCVCLENYCFWTNFGVFQKGISSLFARGFSFIDVTKARWWNAKRFPWQGIHFSQAKWFLSDFWFVICYLSFTFVASQQFHYNQYNFEVYPWKCYFLSSYFNHLLCIIETIPIMIPLSGI
jgi:hypothetical protein